MPQIEILEIGFGRAQLHGTFREFLLRTSDAGQPTSIKAARMEDFDDIVDACMKARVAFHIDRFADGNPAVASGRFCSTRGEKPITVEFNRDGEACFTVEQVREALDTVGLGSWISHLNDKAHLGVEPVLKLTPDIRAELVTSIEAAKIAAKPTV